MRPVLPLILAGLSAATGCVGERQTAPAAKASDTDGTAEPAQVWTVASEPVVEIGVLDGAPEYQFQDVVDVAVQADGDLVVVDAGSAAVRLYDGSGRWLRDVGARGPAPGEFTRPDGVAIDAADTIRVWDGAEWRLSVFDSAGVFVRATSYLQPLLGLSQPPLYPDRVTLLADGSLLIRLHEKSAELLADDRFRYAASVLWAGPDLSTIRRLGRFRGDERVVVESPWGRIPIAGPGARTTLVAASPDGHRRCVADQSDAPIRCWHADGTVVEVALATTGAGSVDLEARELARWRERTRRDFGDKLPPDGFDDLIDGVPLPATPPPYRSIALDPSGRLWVEMGPSGEDGRVVHLVFEPDGTRAGRVTTPAVRLLELTAEAVVAVRADDLGVQYVGVYARQTSAPQNDP